MDIDVETWAEQLMAEVHQLWESLKDQLPKGYAVFYSPVRKNPGLMIIGFNPGGAKHDFCPVRDSKIPLEHEYVTEKYPMADRMWRLFDRIRSSQILENSVKLNLVFFRSRNTTEWNNIDKTLRKQLEDFSFNKVRDIINTLQPKLILAEGLVTYRYLKDLMFIGRNDEEENIVHNGPKTLMLSIGSGPIRLVGIRHPTGSRPPLVEQDWQQIDRELLRIFTECGIRGSISNE